MNEEPLKSVDNRREDGTFGAGNIANPNGRPKGKTLKEFARDFYMLKTDDEKRTYIEALEIDKPGFAWQMAEGNPHQTSESEVKGEQLVIIGDSKTAKKFDEFLKHQSKNGRPEES